jgi:hypothetical protein
VLLFFFFNQLRCELESRGGEWGIEVLVAAVGEQKLLVM